MKYEIVEKIQTVEEYPPIEDYVCNNPYDTAKLLKDSGAGLVSFRQYYIEGFEKYYLEIRYGGGLYLIFYEQEIKKSSDKDTGEEFCL